MILCYSRVIPSGNVSAEFSTVKDTRIKLHL